MGIGGLMSVVLHFVSIPNHEVYMKHYKNDFLLLVLIHFAYTSLVSAISIEKLKYIILKQASSSF